jgi:hypothetical protein
MPPLELVPGVARVVAQYTLNTVAPVNNIFHVAMQISPRPFTQPEIDSVATTVRTAIVDNFMPSLSTQLVLGNVVATDLGSETGFQGTAVGSTAGGNAVGSGFPANVALCISWAIANRYRGGHPRTYLAGLRTDIANNVRTWTGAAVTAWQGRATDFQADVNTLAIGGQPVRIGHVARVRSKEPLSPPQFIIWFAPRVDVRIDSMRSRLGPDVSA